MSNFSNIERTGQLKKRSRNLNRRLHWLSNTRKKLIKRLSSASKLSPKPLHLSRGNLYIR